MTFWMSLVWVLLNQDISLLSILSGVVISALLQIIFPMPRVRAMRTFRPVAALYLLLRFLWDMFTAALQVSWVVLRRKPAQPILVGIELYSDNELYLTIVSNMTCLVPGSIVVRAQVAPSRILLHVLDKDLSGGVEGVTATVRSLEMRVLRALASSEEIQRAQEKRRLAEVPPQEVSQS